jgi:hypothetical protein
MNKASLSQQPKTNTVAIKSGVFWDVTPCCSCKNRGFGGTLRLHHQGVVRLFQTQWLMRSSPYTCLIIVMVSVAHFSDICIKSDAHSEFLCQVHRIRLPYKMTSKINTSAQVRSTLYTNSEQMLVLPSTVESRYYNCCRDGSTSLGNYGYG